MYHQEIFVVNVVAFIFTPFDAIIKFTMIEAILVVYTPSSSGLLKMPPTAFSFWYKKEINEGIALKLNWVYAIII